MSKTHVYISQELLSLKENNRFRSSQPRQAPKRKQQFYENPDFNINFNFFHFLQNGK
jgi:hypothetical protein